jgi:hypothetical protein
MRQIESYISASACCLLPVACCLLSAARCLPAACCLLLLAISDPLPHREYTFRRVDHIIDTMKYQKTE